MSERTCSKCGISKPETLEFFRRRGTKDRGGLRPDCRDCSAARDARYVQANRAKFIAYNIEYRARTKDQKRIRDAAYAATPAGRAARQRAVAKYARTERGRMVTVQASQRRRAILRSCTADLTSSEWSACLDAFGHRCAYCGDDAVVTQEHVVPLSRGGGHTRSNVIPACGLCNRRKFRSLVEVWYPAQPFFDAARWVAIVDYLERAS